MQNANRKRPMPTNLITAPYLADIEMPENLAIGLMISDHRRRCRDQGCDFDYAAYALGQSPFPSRPASRPPSA